METKLYLVRHGQSVANKDAVFAGCSEYPLSELGRKQAEAVGKYLSDIPLDAVYSSPRCRAFDTGAAIAKYHGLTPVRVENLREIYGGQWEGMRFADIETTFPEDYAVWHNSVGYSRPTGGESVAEVQSRGVGCLRELAEKNPGKQLAIATHAMFIRAVLAYVKEKSLAEMTRDTWLCNCSVTTLTYENGKFALLQEGFADHLSGLVTTLPKNI